MFLTKDDVGTDNDYEYRNHVHLRTIHPWIMCSAIDKKMNDGNYMQL